MIVEKNQDKDKFKVLGLLICYVDDILCLMKDGKIKQALFEAMQSLWTMSTEVKLERGQKILYLGLELERTMDGTLEIHQESFVKMILVKHGLDETSKSLSTVSINQSSNGQRSTTRPSNVNENSRNGRRIQLVIDQNPT